MLHSKLCTMDTLPSMRGEVVLLQVSNSKSGVKQGYVHAPALCNLLLDCMARLEVRHFGVCLVHWAGSYDKPVAQSCSGC